jgi:hypothetical protein
MAKVVFEPDGGSKIGGCIYCILIILAIIIANAK